MTTPAPKKKRYALSRYALGRKWWDLVDFDYLSKLTPEELDWLEKFSQETYRNTFKNNETDLHPNKTDARRRVYGDNNARERDMWNQFQRLPHDYTAVTDLDDGDDDK